MEEGNAALINSKYGSVSVKKVATFQLSERYETDFTIDEVQHLKAQKDKYGSFKIGVLTHTFILTGYESNVDVSTIGNTLKEIKIDSKYDNMHFGKSIKLKRF